MKCSPKLMKYTGYLHIIALIVAIYVTFRQIDDVKAGNATSPALAIALTIMLLLRVPNQICVAFKESHGWYSVIGTLVGAVSFAYLAYSEYQTPNKQSHNHQAN
jgi:uncharacterized membrane protein YebE (DUF533 family)